MIVCKSCGKENQEHYRFCLGCGVEIDRAGDRAPEPAAAGAGGGAVGAVATGSAHGGAVAGGGAAATGTGGPAAARGGGDLGGNGVDGTHGADERARAAAAALEAPGVSMTTCGTCGAHVPEFTFCGQCGARLPVGAVAGARPQRTLFLGQQAATQRAARGKLILIRPDGSEGGFHGLDEGENVVGRGGGALFDADNYLSPHHADLILNGGGLVVRDNASLNGVFVKLTDEEEIHDGDVFRIGQELLRFDVVRAPMPLDDGTEVMGSPNPGYWGRVALIIGRDQDGSAFPLFGDAVILGRERGDILFPEDGYVSGTHARVATRAGRYYLADMNSSNGTFMRIRGERAIRSGTFLLMGQQLFRVQFS